MSEQDSNNKERRTKSLEKRIGDDNLVPVSYKEQIEFFTKICESSQTGVKDAGQAMLIFHKAKELGIGWANAIPHMQVINGKAGIDIHIVKAILSKPASGVTWECTEDYKAIYRYTDGKNVFFEESLPQQAQIVPTLKTSVEEGKFPVVLLPEIVTNSDGSKTQKVIPYDYRTSYIFRRTKKDIDGKFIKVVSNKGKFSWREALTAQLPYDRAGNLNPESAWQKYRKLMLDIRAFTFGARDIASDLLMGCYETSELYDIEGKEYIIEDGVAQEVN